MTLFHDLHTNKTKNYSDFSKKIQSEFPDIKGVFVNFNPDNTNKILSDITLKITGEDFIYLRGLQFF